MKRGGIVLVGVFLVAACSAHGNYLFSDDGGSDAGKVKAIEEEEDSGAVTAKDAGGKKDAAKPPPTTPSDVCAPGSVSSFSPSWKAPAAFHQGKCTTTQVDALVSCNFDDTADPTTCDQVLKDAANANCNNCLFTASTSSKLGPVVITGNVGSLNIAGCIADSQGNTTTSGCGAKYQAANDCADESCAACDDSTAAALTEKNQCIQDALTSECQSYATDADCANALLDVGGAAEPCNQGNTFEEAAAAIGKLFCGN
jgi:hypothetical protein